MIDFNITNTQCKSILDEYKERGEKYVLLKNDIKDKTYRLCDFTDYELKEFIINNPHINPHNEINKTIISIVKDCLLKRRIEKLNKIKDGISRKRSR